MASKSGSDMLIDDGIIVWFDGPEWDDVAVEAFEDAADDVLSQARDNAPWADRSGDAKAGLRVNVEKDNGDIVLTLFHTVEYGLWLEVIQSGRFATILPTLERYGKTVMEEAATKIANARQGR